MYKFRDVNEALEDALLPSEALQINGEYIENLIAGYRTLNVSGREAMPSDFETMETGIRDGSSLAYKRYPARTIIVQYQLIAESNEAFREAFNTLGRILDVQDAELIFADEPDKFFKGTPISVEDVEPGKNAVVGEIEFLCVDPFKYSVVEYEATASPEDASTILVNYNGTYKSYPTLQADFFKESEVAEDGETATALTGSGDCGFVAFFNENEKIIQLGNPEEIDIDTSASGSQTLMNQLFTGQYAWGTTAKNLWAVNQATGLVGGMYQNGAVGVEKADDKNYYLKATNYGDVSATLLKAWHGASITRTLSADKSGEVGAENFILTYKQRMCVSKGVLGQRQIGAFQVHCLDENGNSVVGVRIHKNKVGSNASLLYYINGVKVFGSVISLGYNNIYYGASEAKVKACNIRKTGNQIIFNIGVHRKVFTDDNYSGLKVVKVVFAFERYGVQSPLEYNGLYWAKFTKHTDVENSFTANDIVEADCRNGEILLNNVSTPSLGALGNDWEEFFLIPGINQIGTAYSSWVGDAYAPTFKVRYREVFL